MAKINWLNHKSKRSAVALFSDIRVQEMNKRGISKKLENSWFNYFVEKTPGGSVLTCNKYYDYFFYNSIKLLHVTPSLSDIVSERVVYPSGGGLGTAIYCTPLGKNLVPHNLFNLYYSFQIPKKSSEKPKVLCFEIFLNKKLINNIQNWGVDYTTFGKIHCRTWDKIKDKGLCSNHYALNLENSIVKDIAAVRKFLNAFVNHKLEHLSVQDVLIRYKKIFNTLPSLRFIIYEVLCEYILLHQDDKKSKACAKSGELYNLNHKKIVFSLCPSMANRFNMRLFNFKFEDLIDYLEKNKVISNFNEEYLIDFFIWRTAFYLNKICSGPVIATKSFKKLEKKHPYLIGQVVYRDFFDKNLFETNMLPFIRKMMLKEKIVCPIYSILPKGEMGVTPFIGFLGVRYNAYLVDYDLKKNKVNLKNKIKLRIADTMISANRKTIR